MEIDTWLADQRDVLASGPRRSRVHMSEPQAAWEGAGAVTTAAASRDSRRARARFTGEASETGETN